MSVLDDLFLGILQVICDDTVIVEEYPLKIVVV
jgi:hypothetical protein